MTERAVNVSELLIFVHEEKKKSTWSSKIQPHCEAVTGILHVVFYL